MQRVLIANRGEVALRVIRACRKAGLDTVAVYSDADANSPHVWAADRAVCIGPASPQRSYLAGDTIITVALGSGCDAIHPGYGFLAENADFADKCRESGLVFIGPPAEVIARMGDKLEARHTAQRLGLPVVPGAADAFTDATQAATAAADVGFPLMLKAAAGGGGRGMRIIHSRRDFDLLFTQATNEAKAAFDDARIYLERYFDKVRHIEVQVYGDYQGNYRHLGERDCSVQRRHQKLVEEAPSPVLDDTCRREMCEAAIALTEGIEYVNAGTVEFIFDTENGKYFFIEMNTRIQVEHPITEAVTGVDLVLEQLRIAAGEPLSFQDRSPQILGHAVEWRINAEDPDNGFMPRAGRITRWAPPKGLGIRFDGYAYRGYDVVPFYDSLLGKLIVSGKDRDQVINRSGSALSRFAVDGIPTTLPFHRRLIRHPSFIHGEIDTRWVEEEMEDSDEQ